MNTLLYTPVKEVRYNKNCERVSTEVWMEISIICPIYNTSPDILNAAIESVVSQTGKHICEIIIIDDGSTNEDTINYLILLEKRYTCIKIIRSENRGPAHARNLGIEHSNFNWIGFIDADDLWPADKLQLTETVFKEHPDSRWIVGNCEILDNEKVTKGPLLTELIKNDTSSSYSKRFKAPELTKALIYHWCHLGTCVVDKCLLNEIGRFNQKLRYGEDWLLFLKMSTKSHMDYIEKETYILRRQGKSMMRSVGRISSKYLHSSKMAQKEECLKNLKKELRWFKYTNTKDVAMNSLLNSRPLSSLFFAFKAWYVSPLDFNELLFFTSLLFLKNPEELKKQLKKYCTAEQVSLQ